MSYRAQRLVAISIFLSRAIKLRTLQRRRTHKPCRNTASWGCAVALREIVLTSSAAYATNLGRLD